MERFALKVGGEVRATAVRIENRLRAGEELPDEAFAINLGLDRTTVPMAEDEPIERENDFTARGAPDTRRVLRYRMAYVGTVCITDRDGEALVTRRSSLDATRLLLTQGLRQCRSNDERLASGTSATADAQRRGRARRRNRAVAPHARGALR